MINKNNMIRQPMLAAGVALLALVAGCGGGSSQSGDDYADSAGDSAATSSEMPQINDPAVEAAALRTVNPCALLDGKTLGELGTVVPDSVSESDWGECGVDVDDAKGKTIELVLRVGEQLVTADEPSEELEGLPLIVDGDDPGSCWVSVMTSYEQSLGIEFQVDYAGGDACAAGRAALGKVVRTLHAEPPQYQQVPGTVLTADPCTTADKKAVETALGTTTFVEPKSLHQCDLWSGDSTNYPQVSVRFYKGLPAEPGDGQPADLGGGVTAIQVPDKDDDLGILGCDVTWRKVETPTEDEADGYGELVSVEFTGEQDGGVDTAAACEKAVAVAKTVVPKLGQA